MKTSDFQGSFSLGFFLWRGVREKMERMERSLCVQFWKLPFPKPREEGLQRGLLAHPCQGGKSPRCLLFAACKSWNGNLQLPCTGRPKRWKKSMRIRPSNTCQFWCINEGCERRIFLSETLVQALQVQEWHIVLFFCPGWRGERTSTSSSW